jgi:hypothetical protein
MLRDLVIPVNTTFSRSARSLMENALSFARTWRASYKYTAIIYDYALKCGRRLGNYWRSLHLNIRWGIKIDGINGQNWVYKEAYSSLNLSGSLLKDHQVKLDHWWKLQWAIFRSFAKEFWKFHFWFQKNRTLNPLINSKFFKDERIWSWSADSTVFKGRFFRWRPILSTHQTSADFYFTFLHSLELC